MTMDRRTALNGLAAGAAALTVPGLARAQAGGTLDQVKQRGSLRVGVTQAPPWYSKDPRTGEWATGVGVSLGKAMAQALNAQFEPVEVTWGTAIAALQAGKIDIMYMMDATPERAQAVDFPATPLLYYSMALLARDDLKVAKWSDLDMPSVRIAVPQLLACTLLPELMAGFRAQYPGVSLRLVDCAVGTGAVVEQTIGHDAEVGSGAHVGP